MFLLDVNVLFAALTEIHQNHATTVRWLSSVERYASCGPTQIGAFRLLIMPDAMGSNALKPADAHKALARLTGNDRHAFIASQPISSAIVGQTRGHKAAQDDYLVQIASDAGCRLATMDRALTRRWPERAFLIN